MNETSRDWRNLFLGREHELQWLMTAWELITHDSGPQMRVLYAESGFGKTKLAQRFYKELSQNHDDNNYWPDNLLQQGKDLQVMPKCTNANPLVTVPWFWYGLRWPDESDQRNQINNHDVFSAVHDSPLFTVHEEAVLKRVNSKKRVVKVVFLLGKSGLNLAAGSAVDIAQAGLEAYEGIKEVLPLGQQHREANQEMSLAQRVFESEQKVIQNVIHTFSQLLDSKKGEKGSMPVTLLLDNVHSLDELSLKIVTKLWFTAKEKKWPLLILATSWKQEWEKEENEKEGRNFSGWAKEVCDASPDSHGIESMQLQKLPENEQLLQVAFPGLSSETSDYIVERASGNPRHLAEIIHFLEDDPSRFIDEDLTQDLTPIGQMELKHENLDVDQLEKKRFNKVGRALKDLLSLASLQGMTYLKDFTINVASRVDQFAQNQESKELIEQAEKPYAIAEGLNETSMEFRSPNLHRIARAYYDSHEDFYTEMGSIRNAIQLEGLDLVKATGWGKVPRSSQFSLLEFLYDQSRDNQTLRIWIIARALVTIYNGGDWRLISNWKMRWDELEDPNQSLQSMVDKGAVDIGEFALLIGYIHQEQRSWTEALSVYNKALEWSEKTGQHQLLGATGHQIGRIYQELRSWPKALSAYNKALEWNEKTGQQQLLGTTWHQIGMLHQEQRSWQEARSAYDNALKWDEETGQQQQLGATWHHIGDVYQLRRSWKEAQSAYDKSLKWNQETGQQQKLGGTWHNIGMLHQKQRSWQEARSAYDNALKWDEETGQQQQLGATWHSIGILNQEQRSWAEAQSAYNEALKCNEKTGQQQQLGATWHQIGMLHEEQRLWKEALSAYNKALESNEKTGQQQKLGATWHQIGMLHEEQRLWEEALNAYNKALNWKEKTGQQQQLGATWHQIGIVHQEQRSWAKALSAYDKALKWNEETEQQKQLGENWHQIGIVHQIQRSYAKARSAYDKALNWKEETGQQHLLGSTWHQIGMLHQEQRSWKDAISAYNKALKWKEETGQQQLLGETWHQIGIVHQIQHLWQEAQSAYDKALKWKEETGQQQLLGSTWHNIGILHQTQNSYSEALNAYSKAFKWNEKTEQQQLLGETVSQLMLLYANSAYRNSDLKMWEQSAQHARHSLQLFSEYQPHSLEKHINKVYKVAKLFPDRDGEKGKLWEWLETLFEANPELRDQLDTED